MTLRLAALAALAATFGILGLAGCANEIDWRIEPEPCGNAVGPEGAIRELWAITEGPCTATPGAPHARGERGDGTPIPALGRGVWCFWSLRIESASALGIDERATEPGQAPCRLVAIASDERVLPDESGELLSRPRCVRDDDRAGWDRAVEVLASCAPRRDPARCECPLSPSPSGTDPLACGAPIQADFVTMGETHACAAARGDEGFWCWGDARGFGASRAHGASWVKPAIVPASDATWLGLVEELEAGAGQVCMRNGRDQIVCTGERAIATTWPLRRPLGSGELVLARDLGVGDELACAITRDTSRVTCWGRAPDGSPDAIWDEPLPAGVRPDAITVGARHACVLARGRLFCWGCDAEGQVTGRRGAAGATCDEWLAAREIPAPDGAGAWAEVDAGPDRTCAVDDRARLFCWGGGPALSLTTAGSEAQDVSVGGRLTICGRAATRDGTFRCAIDPREGRDLATLSEMRDGRTVPYTAARAGSGVACGLRTRDGAGAVLCRALDERPASDPILGRAATAPGSEAVCPTTRRD